MENKIETRSVTPGRVRTYFADCLRIIRLGFPVLVSQLGTIVVGFADNIMVGHYSTDALASASFVNNIFNLPMLGAMGFSYGITPIVGALFTNGNREKIGRVLRAAAIANLVLALALMFGLIGFADDFIKVKKKRNLGLTGLQKLVLQVLAACLFLAGMHFTNALTYDLYIPFVREPLVHIPPLVYLALSVFIIVGCVNAVNLTDGIDGLATGVTLPVMLFFTLVSMTAKQWGLATFPATLVGALGGFLFYNFYPAKTFMGDTGSLYLGGAVCGLAYALDMPLVLLFVGLIYIIETLSDILQVSYFKLTHGKRIFKMAPIHHHFEMCGWSEKKIWVVFVSATVIMCVIAWFGVRIWF